MEDDWTYQDEDFDEDLPYVELQFGIEDLNLLYKSVSVHYEKWPGGDVEEQARLSYLKNFLYRIILEWKYEMD
jgi:hypothetical protein